MTRLERVCMKEGRVSEDSHDVCVFPIYKGKGGMSEGKNYRGISMLSIPGKVFGRVEIERIQKATEWGMGEEQCGFRRGRGCVDQVLPVKQFMEKYCERNKCTYSEWLSNICLYHGDQSPSVFLLVFV